MVTIRKPKNALKFSKPASWWGSSWREALPCGNGEIGAAVYGGAADDTVMITHSDLWWQGHVGVLQDVSDKLKDVRKKLDESAPREAENIFANAFISKGYRPLDAFPLPLCDFKVKMKTDKAIKEYARILNMENGEVSVTFKDGTTRFERSLFVSQAQNLIAYEITHAGAKTIDVTFSLDIHDKFNARTPSAVSKLPDGINVRYENYFMYFSARSDNGTEFGLVGFINHYGGSQTVDPVKGISIKGADKVLVLLKPFIESQREKEWKNLKSSLSGIKLTYEKLLKEHTPLHSKMFSSAELDFDADNKERDLPVEELLGNVFQTAEMSGALLEKLWAFGRYLMVTGTKKASLPMAPYGLWCGDYKAPFSQITASGSLQTIYSHALAGNMTEYLESIFTYYESVMSDLKKNSSRIYASRGIFIPSQMAHGTGVLGSVDSSVIHFTGVAGWVAQLFYDYYLFTDDKTFLKNRALPFMREVALFYEDFFKVTPENIYESSPSYSPHTTPGNFIQNGEMLNICKNATVDFEIAKELLTNLIEGSELANANKSDIAKWKDMLTRIPPYPITSENTVCEYADSKYADNPSATSTAMFYPVFPGTEVNSRSANNELKKAFENTLKKKTLSSVGAQSSMSLSRYASIFTRLGGAEDALSLIVSSVRGMAMNNLMFASSDWRGMGMGRNESWANYTVETNMGITCAVQEMLVQSDKNSLSLLPACPDLMSKGSLSGIITRCGVEVVEFTWDKRKGIFIAKLKAKKAAKVDLYIPLGGKKLKPTVSQSVDFEQGVIKGLELPSNKPVTIDIKF